MADEKDIPAATPATPASAKAKAAAAAPEEDKFPNRAKYEDGFVFNMPIYHYEKFTEDEIRQAIIDAGNEKEVIEPHMDLIKEALIFHDAHFKEKK